MYSYDRRKTAYIGNFRETMDSFYGDLSGAAKNALEALDEKFVGTPNYMGIANFWNVEYKYELRGATTAVRRAVHAAFLKEGLVPQGVSPMHEAVLRKLGLMS